MKNIIFKICIIQFVFVSQSIGQLFNDGAEITIQQDVLVHIQGDFTNQGGVIFNEGLIEIGGDWLNTVSTNPLNPGTGTVEMVGDVQTIGGGFNTLFNNVSLRENQAVILESTIGIGNSVNLNNGVIDLNTNTLHILNPANTALQASTGSVRAETSDSYGFVRWDVGEEAEGQYTVPFVNDFDVSLPVVFELNTQGEGEQGYLLLSTFGTDETNSPLPLDVTNNVVNGDDSGLNLVDRFWIVRNNDYVVSPNTSLSISFDDVNEAADPNVIAVDQIEVIHWDATSSSWSSLGAGSGNDNVITTQLTDAYGDFALWSNNPSSIVDLEKLVNISTYPNPSQDFVTIDLLSDKQDIAQVMIYDELGNIVFISSHNIQNGNNRFLLDVSDLPKGAYHSVVRGSLIHGINKFIKM